MIVPEAPQNLMGDNAYDPDELVSELRKHGIELIAPHRSNRKESFTRLTTPAPLSPTLEG
jgi:hypothetical protein